MWNIFVIKNYYEPYGDWATEYHVDNYSEKIIYLQSTD